MITIRVKNLTKRYGNNIAVNNISFDVEKGDFFGFIGPNGAGKTTTIKAMLGLLKTNSGSIELLGDNINNNNFQAHIGLVPGEANLYGNLKVKDQIRYFAEYYNNVDPQYLDKLKDMFELKEDKRISSLSLGNKKKVAIVCALMNKPQLLIFDEVSNSLDPLMQKILFEELARLSKAGTTVFFSSHNLEEVQTYCKNLAIIRGGKIIKVDNVKKIIAGVGLQITLRTKQEIDKGYFAKHNINFKALGTNAATFIYKGDINELVKHVSKYNLESLRITDVKLEDIFGDYYEGEE